MIPKNFIDNSQDFVSVFIDDAQKQKENFSTRDIRLFTEVLKFADTLKEDQDSIPTILCFNPNRFRHGIVFGDFRPGILLVGKAILDEIHAALCKNNSRYQKETKELISNIHLLIGAVGGYVAAQIGVAIAIVSALTAILIKLTLSIGINAFCKVWSESRESSKAE